MNDLGVRSWVEKSGPEGVWRLISPFGGYGRRVQDSSLPAGGRRPGIGWVGCAASGVFLYPRVEESGLGHRPSLAGGGA